MMYVHQLGVKTPWFMPVKMRLVRMRVSGIRHIVLVKELFAENFHELIATWGREGTDSDLGTIDSADWSQINVHEALECMEVGAVLVGN